MSLQLYVTKFDYRRQVFFKKSGGTKKPPLNRNNLYENYLPPM